MYSLKLNWWKFMKISPFQYRKNFTSSMNEYWPTTGDFPPVHFKRVQINYRDNFFPIQLERKQCLSNRWQILRMTQVQWLIRDRSVRIQLFANRRRYVFKKKKKNKKPKRRKNIWSIMWYFADISRPIGIVTLFLIETRRNYTKNSK